jgi:hypothetical protein
VLVHDIGNEFAPRIAISRIYPGQGDLDDDGAPDDDDVFPLDGGEWADGDGDGVGDNGDAFPSDSSEWADSDGDGLGDRHDFLPAVPAAAWVSFDGKQRLSTSRAPALRLGYRGQLHVLDPETGAVALCSEHERCWTGELRARDGRRGLMRLELDASSLATLTGQIADQVEFLLSSRLDLPVEVDLRLSSRTRGTVRRHEGQGRTRVRLRFEAPYRGRSPEAGAADGSLPIQAPGFLVEARAADGAATTAKPIHRAVGGVFEGAHRSAPGSDPTPARPAPAAGCGPRAGRPGGGS